MRSYGVARGLFSFLEVVAWLGVVGGVLAFFGASSLAGPGLGIVAVILGAMFGVFLTLSCLLMIAVIQIGRATVDSAEYGQQSLDVARKQLAVSQQALRLRSDTPQSFVALQPADAPTEAQRSEAPTATASFAEMNSDASAEVDPSATSPSEAAITSRRKPLFPLIAARYGNYSYRGGQIIRMADGYLYNGQLARTAEEAAVWIDDERDPKRATNGAAT